MKNNKGITLISLVITIIVLLILAGVSIAMLSGDNSILSRASVAAEESAVANTKELVVVAVNEALAEYNARLYVNNDNTENLLSTLLAEKLGTAANATTGAIPEAKKISGISVDPKTGADNTYEVKFKTVKKAEFSINTTTGALTWTPVTQ